MPQGIEWPPRATCILHSKVADALPEDVTRSVGRFPLARRIVFSHVDKR